MVGELRTLAGIAYTTGFTIVATAAAGLTGILGQQVIIEPGTTYLSLEVVIALVGTLLSVFSGGGYLVFRIVRLVNRYEARLSALESGSDEASS